MSQNNPLLEEVRARVAKALEELDGVVALRMVAGGGAPHLFRPGDDLEDLVLTPHYGLAPIVMLLAKRYPEARLGVVARACDLRALVELAKRELVSPNKVYVISVVCTPEEAQECACEEAVPNLESWPQGELVGEKAPGLPQGKALAESAQMSLEERRAFWQNEFAQCMKCYGCRNICPMCHCQECSLEDPLWVEPGELAPAFPTFHLIRAMHMAGRCIDCGQCEEVCPAGIPLRQLYRQMAKDVEEQFGYRPGRDTEEPLPILLTLE